MGSLQTAVCIVRVDLRTSAAKQMCVLNSIGGKEVKVLSVFRDPTLLKTTMIMTATELMYPLWV